MTRLDTFRPLPAQIKTRRYDEVFLDDGIEKVLKYGIACYKKMCRVALVNG